MEKYDEFQTLPNVFKENFALRRSKKLEIVIARFAAGSLVGDESVFLNKEVEHSLNCATNEGVLIVLNKTVCFYQY